MALFKYRVLNALVYIECLVMVFFYMFSANGWLAYTQLCAQKNALVCELEAIRQDISGLETELENFQHDDFYKEKIAREQLHMARPDDIVIYLPKGNAL